MSALEISHLSKHYQGHIALSDVSFSVPKGSIFGLLGHNGAGKSTLLRIVTQIAAPDQGEISFMGQALQPDHRFAMGYLPEERGLYKKMKVLEQLVYLGKLRGLDKREARDKSEAWLQKLHLHDWANKTLTALSKGMQQKVQFIATILHDPEFIILDEPFSGFDPLNVEIIQQEILELNQQGKTIVFSTHQMESVEALCQHIALLNKGQCVYSGSVQELKQQFDQNSYRISTMQAVDWPEPFLPTSSQETQGTWTYEMHQVHSPSSLLAYVNPDHLVSFERTEPTLRDIFLKIVSDSAA